MGRGGLKPRGWGECEGGRKKESTTARRGPPAVPRSPPEGGREWGPRSQTGSPPGETGARAAGGPEGRPGGGEQGEKDGRREKEKGEVLDGETDGQKRRHTKGHRKKNPEKDRLEEWRPERPKRERREPKGVRRQMSSRKEKAQKREV